VGSLHASGADAKSGAAAKAVAPNSLKAAFQVLLDRAAQAAKGDKAEKGEKSEKTAEPVPNKAKLLRAEAILDKTKDSKDHKKIEAKETKDHKAAPDPALAPALVLPKADVPAKTAKTVEADLAAERTKAARTDKRGAGEVAPVANLGAEGKGSSVAAISIKAERTDEKPKVFVVDKRTEKEKDKLKGPGAEASAQQPVGASAEAQNQPKTADAKSPGDVQVNFQVAAKGKEGFDLTPQNTPVPPRDAASFQHYLVERGYGQLVEQARIVLKDQNAGEIRMTLYPETLGKVKVSLNMTDSSLAGRIFVENQTVKDVFQANMDGLMQAFKDGGWSNLSLQVSVGGGGGNQAGQQQPAPQARDYDRQVAQTVTESRTDRVGSWNDRQVDLTA
jgi:flagellar hook-length control protein FliK